MRAEYCERIQWPLPWDLGAPRPFVVAAEDRLILGYIVGVYHPALSLADVAELDLTPGTELVGLVCFPRCFQHRFGQPYPDFPKNHPLAKVGLDEYQAHIVRNSAWLAELSDCGGAAPLDLEALQRAQHFIFTFHDEVLECLSSSPQIWVAKTSLSHARRWALVQLDNYE